MAVRGVEVRRHHRDFWDLRTIRALLVLLHGSFGLVCGFIRPNLFEISDGYSGLFALMPTREWGYVGLVIALAVFLLRRPAPLQILSQLASGGLITAIVVGITSGSSGLNLGAMAYGVFGLASLWAIYRAFGMYLETQAWYRRWQASVDRWRGRRGR